MNTKDIKIGETYRHKRTPNIGYAKALKIIIPKKDDFLKSEDEKKLKCIAVKCEWTSSKQEEYKDGIYYLIKYFKPSDLKHFLGGRKKWLGEGK